MTSNRQSRDEDQNRQNHDAFENIGGPLTIAALFFRLNFSYLKNCLSGYIYLSNLFIESENDIFKIFQHAVKKRKHLNKSHIYIALYLSFEIV